jgi:hypothetical protein
MTEMIKIHLKRIISVQSNTKIYFILMALHSPGWEPSGTQFFMLFYVEDVIRRFYSDAD